MKRHQTNSLLAAAQKLTKKRVDAQALGRGRSKNIEDTWQSEAWDMYDLVGELRFLASNLAGQASKAHLYVGKQVEGEKSPERVDDDAVNRLLEAVGGSAQARTQLIYRLMVNLYIAGEGWQVGVPYEDEDGDMEITDDPADFEWRMMSVSEVSVNSMTSKIELKIDDDTREYDLEDVYLIRVWRPHPRNWWEADSPTRSSLSILRELVGLTMHVAAQVDSRLAGAGMLIVPQSAQRALQVAAGIDENETDTDEFTDALIESMVTPVSDRSSASALVPLVVTVPDESTGAFEYINFDKPLDTEARNLRDEAIRRLSLGMDAPPELLLGTGGMNHWGGWLVQEETVTTHIEPPLGLICEAMTSQYLWPALEELGYTDFQDYVITYDVDHLITRPNLSGDAFNLHEKGAISDDALRRVSGFDEQDAPERPVDLATSTVLRMVESNPNLMVNPGIEALVEQIRGLITGNPSEPVTDTGNDDTADSDTATSAPDSSQMPDTDGDPAEPTA